MLKYTIKRILWMIPVILMVIIIVFSIMYFSPGDPVKYILGSNITPEIYAAKKADMGLDKPFLVQLFNYLKNIILHFDFGVSYVNNRSVITQIGERLGITIVISVCSTIISQFIAIPAGIAAAKKQGRLTDYFFTSLSVILAAIPGYLLAVFAMLLFCAKLKWFPAAGVEDWKGFILPIFCGIFGHAASTCRMTRSSMLEVIRSDYVRTARAKGVPEKVVINKHALNNALIPVLTMLGMHLSGCVAGSILIETIFTVPGMGVLMRTAIASFDYPLVQGCIIITSMCVAVLSLLTDLAYAIVDPRVHDQMSGGKKKKKKKTDSEVAAV